jgi:hypothetical protein
MSEVPEPEGVRDEASYRRALTTIKDSVVGTAGQVASLQERLKSCNLFPPPDCSDEVMRTFVRDHSALDGDDVRVQTLFRLRDHVLRTERQVDRLTTVSRASKEAVKLRQAAMAGIAMKSYQTSLRMLQDYVKYLTDTDLAVHKEARETLELAADVSLREQELKIQEKAALTKKAGRDGVRGLLEELAHGGGADDAP